MRCRWISESAVVCYPHHESLPYAIFILYELLRLSINIKSDTKLQTVPQRGATQKKR
jgi:hypothetical protein